MLHQRKTNLLKRRKQLMSALQMRRWLLMQTQQMRQLPLPEKAPVQRKRLRLRQQHWEQRKLWQRRLMMRN